MTKTEKTMHIGKAVAEIFGGIFTAIIGGYSLNKAINIKVDE